MAADNKQQRTWPYGKHLYIAVFFAAVLLVANAVYRTVSQPLADNNLTQEMLVKLTVLVPVIAIWLIAARGAERFKKYAYSISKSDDGQSMNYIADGLLLLVVYIIILNFISSIILLASGTQLLAVLTVLANHIPVVVAVLASILLYRGSKKLSAMVKGSFWTKKKLLLALVPYLLFMIVLAVDFVQGASSLMSSSGQSRFAMPAPVLLFTYFVPHAVVWLLGILSAGNLAWYAKHVPGKIYKQLFSDIHKGIVLVYLAVFSAQLLISSPSLGKNASLAFTLLYAVLVLAISGYVYIYKGSARLQQVEDII